jgi:hypothetical protein
MPDSPQERYERIQEILQQSILRDYPNPERQGCPGADVLKRMAERTRPVRDAEWEHVTHCSPCYREFLDFRAEVLERQLRARRVRRLAIAAGVVLVIAGLSAYFAVSNRGGSSVAKRQQPGVVQPNLVSAVLNLESESQERGIESQQPKGELQRLPRKPLALSIYLPFGSEPGEYEVRLLNNEKDSQPIATYKAAAKIENGLTVLRLAMDLSSVPPGPHVLATRHAEESWRYFRFIVG